MNGMTQFEAPVFRDFLNANGDPMGGWTTSPLPPPVGTRTAVAEGTASTNDMYFTLAFVPDTDVPLWFSLQAYNGDSLVYATDARWFASTQQAGQNFHVGWNFTTSTWDQTTPVPEPISMVMLGCLGAGMFGARMLRRRT